MTVVSGYTQAVISDTELGLSGLDSQQLSTVLNFYTITLKLFDIYKDTYTQIYKENLSNQKTIAQLAGDFYTTLKILTESAQSLSVLENSSKLGENQKRCFQKMSSSLKSAVYICNKTFTSKNGQEYSLVRDFEEYLSVLKSLLKSSGVQLNYRQFDNILTKSDYITEVIQPLINNALDHAFKTKIPSPEINIYSAIEPEKNLYKIIVGDNGDGIPEQILPRIFEKGFTTKKDILTEHGIGLWGVKEFVESCGGEITVETSKLGTIFVATTLYQIEDCCLVQKLVD